MMRGRSCCGGSFLSVQDVPIKCFFDFRDWWFWPDNDQSASSRRNRSRLTAGVFGDLRLLLLIGKGMQPLLSHLQNWLTLAHLRLTKKLSTMRICGHWNGGVLFSSLHAILRGQSKDACLRSFSLQPISESLFRLNLAHFGSLSEVYGTGDCKLVLCFTVPVVVVNIACDSNICVSHLWCDQLLINTAA